MFQSNMPAKISEQEYIQRIQSAGINKFEFIGWEGEFKRNTTKAILRCIHHKDYKFTVSIQHILGGRGCPWCAGKKKLTQFEVENELLELGAKFICFPYGYKNKNSICEMYCDTHGEWESDVSSILGGKECPKCGCARRNAKRIKSIEEVESDINDICLDKKYNFIKWVDSYTSAGKSRILVECLSDGNVFETTPAKLKYGYSCPQCSGKKKWSETERVSAINKIGIDRFTFLGFIGDFIDNKTRCSLKCLHCEHTWTSTINNIINHGRGCPCCSKHGFNIREPAWFYVYKWIHPSTGDSFYKYGITNRTPSIRVKSQMKGTEYLPSMMMEKWYANGIDAKLVEDTYRSAYPTIGITRDLFGDGYTETFREN